MDDLVKEYLLSRGFTATARQLEIDLKNDKDKSFRPDKIVDQFTAMIAAYDLSGLRDLWNHYDISLFERMEHHFMPAIKKMENSILRMYLINAAINTRQEKVHEFFEKLGPDLQNQTEWKDWFSFPFIKNPEENPAFAVYFTKQWQDTMFISLHNLLAISFQCLPQPKLMAYREEASKISRLQSEADQMKAKLARLNLSESQESSNMLTIDNLPPGLDLVDDFYLIPDASPIDSSSRLFRNFIRGFGNTNVSSSSNNTSPLTHRRVSPLPVAPS